MARGEIWTEEEDAVLMAELKPPESRTAVIERLARKLGRTPKSIIARYYRLLHRRGGV